MGTEAKKMKKFEDELIRLGEYNIPFELQMKDALRKEKYVRELVEVEKIINKFFDDVYFKLRSFCSELEWMETTSDDYEDVFVSKLFEPIYDTQHRIQDELSKIREKENEGDC